MSAKTATIGRKRSHPSRAVTPISGALGTTLRALKKSMTLPALRLDAQNSVTMSFFPWDFPWDGLTLLWLSSFHCLLLLGLFY